ncbi:hypothetical protein D3C84_619310 [compost metagenome]
MQAQVQGLRLVRGKIHSEQVVVLADFATGERQGIAGLPGQFIVAACIRQIQVEVIERRVSQFQQPGPLRSRVGRAVMQIDFQPEHRTRVTGVEGGFIMRLEVAGRGLRTDIRDGQLTTDIFKHLQGSPEGKALGEFIELNGVRQEGQTQHKHQQIAHSCPSVACPVLSGSPPFLLSRRKTGDTCYWFGSTLA